MVIMASQSTHLEPLEGLKEQELINAVKNQRAHLKTIEDAEVRRWKLEKAEAKAEARSKKFALAKAKLEAKGNKRKKPES